MSIIDIDKLKIPTLPATVRDCISQIYNANVDLGHIASIAQKDPGIVSSILKIANSTAYSSGKPTSDLKTAMTRIGITTVVQIFVSQSIESLFKIDPAIHFFSIKSFTKHSSWVSQIAFELAKIAEIEGKNDLLIAGLVHDVGLLAQLISNRDNFKKMVETCLRDKCDLASAERKMGFDSHDELGAQILERWKLPENVIKLVKYHHTTSANRDKNMTTDQNKAINILILADLTAHRFGNAFVNYPRDTKINKIDLDKAGLSNKDLTAAVKIASTQLSNY